MGNINFNPSTPEGQEQLQKEGVDCDPTPYCYGSMNQVKTAAAEEKRNQDLCDEFDKALGNGSQESGGILGVVGDVVGGFLRLLG
jgi:hypothetical protein